MKGLIFVMTNEPPYCLNLALLHFACFFLSKVKSAYKESVRPKWSTICHNRENDAINHGMKIRKNKRKLPSLVVDDT